jgi:hypothetical protein
MMNLVEHIEVEGNNDSAVAAVKGLIKAHHKEVIKGNATNTQLMVELIKSGVHARDVFCGINSLRAEHEASERQKQIQVAARKNVKKFLVR